MAIVLPRPTASHTPVPPHGSPTARDLLRGIGAGVLAAALFTSTHAAIKALGAEVSLSQLVGFRSLFALVPLLPFLLREPRLVRTRRPGLHAIRCAAGLASMALYFFALTRAPLATVTALNFTMPLWVTLLSIPILGEQVGWRRWSAVLIGFAGVVVMVRPDTSSLDWVYLATLASALLYAIVVIAMRRLGSTERSPTTALYFALAGAAAGFAVMPFDWRPLSLSDAAILAGIGIVSGVAQLLMTVAYRLAPAAIVAPFDYTALLWATLFGLLLFAEVPAWHVLAGAVVLVASGLYILHRETRLARERSARIGA